jgi:hypothetical protein
MPVTVQGRRPVRDDEEVVRRHLGRGRRPSAADKAAPRAPKPACITAADKAAFELLVAVLCCRSVLNKACVWSLAMNCTAGLVRIRTGHRPAVSGSGSRE